MVSLLDRFSEWLNPKPKRTYVDLREKREQDAMKVHLLAKFGKMFALALLLASPASAELVGAQFRDFSGGLNDSTDPTALLPNQSPDLLNLVVDDPAGAAKPRNGFTTCGKLPSGSAPTELYNYSKTDGTQYLIATDNTNIYQTGDCSSWTRIATGLSSNSKPSFSTIRNDLWFVNGSTWAFKWDGSTTTQIDGTLNTPNPAPPRGRYIEFWRERVWIAATSGDPSILAWSALTDSAGNDITPSTGTGAWPATNALYIDRDGGSRIYGIKAYRDNLYVFKGNGIWRIVFNNDFDITVVRTLSSVGSRFGSSIVELDNLLYFVGPDGIYSFDGDNSVRLSDRIYQKFKSIRQPLTSEGFKIWSSADDFAAGTMLRFTTTTVVGSIVPTMIKFDDYGDGDLTSSPQWVGDVGWTVPVSSMQHRSSTSEETISSTASLQSGIWSFSGKLAVASEGTRDLLEFVFQNDRTSFSGIDSAWGLIVCYKVPGLCSPTPALLLVEYVASGREIRKRFENVTIDANWHEYRIHASGNEFDIYMDNSLVYSGNPEPSSRATIGDSISIGFRATNQDGILTQGVDNVMVGVSSHSMFTSEIYQAVSLSSWSVFDSEYNANEASIYFQIRVGTDSGAVQASAWSDIAPGSIIPGSTSQAYVQWRAIIDQSTASVRFPSIDSVSINYLRGGSQSQTIYGGRWRNRYWVSASTGPGGSNDMVLVNGRFDKSSWVPYDLQVGPFVVFNDNFYAGASTYSAVQRMDYGTNDAGAPISWYWTSRDEAWGQPLNRKRLMEISTDFRRASGASSVSVGFSRDQGVTFTSSSFSMAGTGRDTDTRYVNGQNSFDFRLRFGSTSLDVAPTIIGITGWANIQPGRQ